MKTNTNSTFPPTLDNTQLLPPPFIHKACERDKTEKGRVKAYRLRTQSGNILGGRISKCGKIPHNKGSKYIDVVKKENSMYYTGLTTCCNVWACPVCSLKISQHRAEKLTNFLQTIQHTNQYKIGFLTLTIRHNLGETCQENKDALLKAYRKITKSRYFVKLLKLFNVTGFVRALEIKYSIKTGWHPHFHILIIQKTQSDQDTINFSNEFTDLWVNELREKAEKSGQKYIPVLNYQGISEYVTKFQAADEICRQPTKTQKKDFYSFNIFDMLLYIENNMYDKNCTNQINLFKIKIKEFYQAFKGAKQLTYSRSLLILFADLICEKTDIEIGTEKQENEEIILSIDKEIYKKAVKYKIEADILNILQFETFENLILFLREFGIFCIIAGQTLKKSPV